MSGFWWKRIGVVPLTGHVDRNVRSPFGTKMLSLVVPLTGHVDRNEFRLWVGLITQVVPLTGHVDRNL